MARHLPLLAVLLALSMSALSATGASAHTLTNYEAAKAAKKSGQQHVRSHYWFDEDDNVPGGVYARKRYCTRWHRHRVHCAVAWTWESSSHRTVTCAGTVRVILRGRWIIWSKPSRVDCD